jgi:hypothetical protein
MLHMESITNDDGTSRAVRSEVGRIKNMTRESLISELVDCATNWIVERNTDLDPGSTDQGPSAIRAAYRLALGVLP